MEKKVIFSKKVPAAIGPYSQCIFANGVYYFSGMLGVDPASGTLGGTTAAQQAEQVCKNIRTLLEDMGLTPDNVVKTTVYLTDMAQFSAVNEVYGRLFSCNPPARSCVAVAHLPKDALVEIECIATK